MSNCMAFVAEVSCIVLVGHEIYAVLVPRPWAGRVAVELHVGWCPYSPPQSPRSEQWLLKSPLSADLCPTWRSAGSKTHTAESCFLKNTTACDDQLSRTFWDCVCVSSVAQLCLTLCNPMDYGLPGSSAYGIFQVNPLYSAVNLNFMRAHLVEKSRVQKTVLCICVSFAILHTGLSFLYRILFVSNLPSFHSHLTHEDHLESWSSEYYFLISSAQIFKILVPSYYPFSYCVLLVPWLSVSLVHLHFDASNITLRIILIVVVVQ